MSEAVEELISCTLLVSVDDKGFISALVDDKGFITDELVLTSEFACEHSTGYITYVIYVQDNTYIYVHTPIHTFLTVHICTPFL